MLSTLSHFLAITLRQWVRGIRFYIGVATGLFTVEVWWWVTRAYSGSSLYGIRAEEAYAWIAMVFLVAALSIGPLYRVFPRLPEKRLLFESRRLFGVGAAWFASLHVLIAYGSLFSFSNPFTLPGVYQRSFSLGTFAWLVLLALAFTSFNGAMRRLGPWWFRLHRLVYLAVVATLLHAFMIGTHASTTAYVIGSAVVSLTLLLLHSFAIAKQGRQASNLQLASVVVMTAALLIIMSFGYDHRKQHKTSQSRGTSAQIY